MADPTDLDRAVAAFTAAVQEHREAAVALDRYRIGAWLRERGHADLARAVEHGDHIDDDQPAIPSLRLVMAARDEALRRANAAEAEVERLRELVRSAFFEGMNTEVRRGGDAQDAWHQSTACAEVSRG